MDFPRTCCRKCKLSKLNQNNCHLDRDGNEGRKCSTILIDCQVADKRWCKKYPCKNFKKVAK